jgi:glucose-6-phosphate 1-dehydrogenase
MNKKKFNFIVFGGSGDLAERKIFPALFSLYCRRYLPDEVNFFAFARTSLTPQAFRHKISSNLTCRYFPDKSSCDKLIKGFLSRCHYISGRYDSVKSFERLYDTVRTFNGEGLAKNIFYLAVPSCVFDDIAAGLSCAENVIEEELLNSKLVIEKPFGHNRSSSDLLTESLRRGFREDQIYRIDHYLGKEMVQNLLVLRFANRFLEPLWSSEHIEKVKIIWTEDRGVFGRGKYFDNYGIIRDVMQNHLLQILALVAMEEPASLHADDIRNQKVELLEAVNAIVPNSVLTGQYSSAVYKGVNVAGYTDEPSVPQNSMTPTFAKIALNIDNERWRGTPFEMVAGKGMPASKAEVRIKFKKADNEIFCDLGKCPEQNEMIIRIQPDEGFHFKISTKQPGSKIGFAVKDLDLSYNQAFTGELLPEAYENLILDIIRGKKELFIRDDELSASWDILMPVLNYLEKKKIVPEHYPFGSCGPEQDVHEKDCPCSASKS